MVPRDSEADRFFDTLPIFCDLTPLQLEQARAVLSLMRVEAGYTLMAVDTPGEMVYIVADGSVKIYAHSKEAEIILGIRGPGEVLGEMSVIDGMKRSATVVAQEPTILFCLSHADFWEVLWEMPPVPYNLVRSLTQRTRVLTSQVQAFSTLDVQGRLARQLVILAQEYGRPDPENGADALLIPFQLKQTEIAAMIGATREQVNGFLSSWRRRGFITRDRVRNAHIVVRCSDKLRAFYE